MFIDEYCELGLPQAVEVAERCLLFEGAMLELVGREPQALNLQGSDLRVAIHAHCHAKALTDVAMMGQLVGRISGASVQLLDSGCCGMAGAFGLLEPLLSEQVAQPLLEAVQALPEGTCLVASGTSCRHQLRDLAGVEPLHMAELLAAVLQSA
jgi:Fe-S oxidoreductase